MFETFKKHHIFLSILAFLVIYSVLTILKHSNFQTSAFDLGIFDQVMWRYSTFQAPYSSLKQMIILGDHFTPILILFVPLYWLWSDPRTLLVLQVTLVCLSAWPIYRIARDVWGDDNKLSVLGYQLLTASYLLYIGTQDALDFDFHLATITIFPLSFLFFSLHFKKWRLYWLFLLLSLLTKEDVPTVVIALGLYEIVALRRYRLGILTTVVSSIYFYLVIAKIMPIFSSQIAGGYINFGNLGSSPLEIVTTALRTPGVVIREFFYPPVKRATLSVMLKSFGFFPLLSFFSWFVSLPFLGERFLSTAPLRWQLGFHYSVNIAPILAVGSVYGINNLTKLRPGRKALIVLVSVLAMSWLAISVNRQYRPLIYRFFEKKTYRMDSGSLTARRVLPLIPKDASVSAQSPFVPHLSQRDKVYLYPEKKGEVEYIVLSLDKSTYPLLWHEMVVEVEELLRDERFELAAQENNVYLFKRSKDQRPITKHP